MKLLGDCVNRLQQRGRRIIPKVRPSLVQLVHRDLEIRMSQQYWRNHQHQEQQQQQQYHQQQQEYRRRRQQILVTFDRSLYRTDLELVLL